MSELRKRFLLPGYPAEHYSEDNEKRSEIVRNGFCHPQDNGSDKNREHCVIAAQEGIQSDFAQPLGGLGGKGGRIEIVDKTDVAAPVDEYEGYKSEWRSKTGHPLLESGFFHLRKFLDLVVVHIQRVKCRFPSVIFHYCVLCLGPAAPVRGLQAKGVRTISSSCTDSS